MRAIVLGFEIVSQHENTHPETKTRTKESEMTKIDTIPMDPPAEFRVVVSQITVPFTADDILVLPPLDVVRLLKEVVNGSDDLEVTALLARHLNARMEDALRDFPELAIMSDEDLEAELSSQAEIDAAEQREYEREQEAREALLERHLESE